MSNKTYIIIISILSIIFIFNTHKETKEHNISISQCGYKTTLYFKDEDNIEHRATQKSCDWIFSTIDTKEYVKEVKINETKNEVKFKKDELKTGFIAKVTIKDNIIGYNILHSFREEPKNNYGFISIKTKSFSGRANINSLKSNKLKLNEDTYIIIEKLN